MIEVKFGGWVPSWHCKILADLHVSLAVQYGIAIGVYVYGRNILADFNLAVMKADYKPPNFPTIHIHVCMVVLSKDKPQLCL